MTVTNPTKNNASVTNQSKNGGNLIWSDATRSWSNSSSDTWALQSLIVTNPTKNTASVTNQAKS